MTVLDILLYAAVVFMAIDFLVHRGKGSWFTQKW